MEGLDSVKSVFSVLNASYLTIFALVCFVFIFADVSVHVFIFVH